MLSEFCFVLLFQISRTVILEIAPRTGIDPDQVTEMVILELRITFCMQIMSLANQVERYSLS